jgi:UDP-2-acetamido-2-deoxy-ribo-hexuluronate aminotransferase
VHYPSPLHRQPAYRRYATGDLPVCETLAERVVSLPMHPDLTESVQDRIVAETTKALVAPCG